MLRSKLYAGNALLQVCLAVTTSAGYARTVAISRNRVEDSLCYKSYLTGLRT